MRDHRREDRGYALVLLALMLVPLLGAASLAVDLGSRYAEAARIQRAADAAALAGVTVLPRGLSAATTEARQVAARNGFTHNPPNGVTVDVTQTGPERLTVRIRQPRVARFFSAMFASDVHVARSATAKYVRAVSLGSPRNFLGTGDLLGSSSGGDMQQMVGFSSPAATAGVRENYWLAISGQCSSKENGDRFNTISQANHGNTSNPRGIGENASWVACDPGGSVQSNPEFRSYGYIYAVTAPSEYNLGQLRIQVFDPATCNSSRPGDPSSASSEGMTTTYTVRTGQPDPLAGTVVSVHSAAPRSTGCNSWVTIATVNPPTAGATYFVQVQAGRNSNGGTHSNGFALRAEVPAKNASGRFWGCSSDPVDTALDDPKCPQVYAVQDMGVAANLTGSRAEFFLASIGPEYNGKRIDITLFDPGEGADSLRIKEPDGDYATFDWTVDCPPGAPAEGGCSGSSATRLDLVGHTVTCSDPDVDTSTPRDGSPDRCASNKQPGPRRTSRSKYNDRSLTLTVDLPTDIASAYGGATWWKIEYTTNVSPTDRTTWSVEVRGDPVRLVTNPAPVLVP